MTRAIGTLALIGILASPTALGEETAKSVVLDGQHARALLKQCSRASPSRFKATWAPSESDIKEAEAQLPTLQVKDVYDYYRQYVGIVIGDRKLIYVNAFHSAFLELADLKERWRREPVMVCDGGKAFWGAVYDPQTKKFSGLALNGQA